MSTRLYLSKSEQQALWPTFEPHWLVAEHDGFVVLDKPVGIATISSDPRISHGFIERAQDYLSQRAEGPTKLYPVQRLDAETSGIMLAATHPKRAKDLSLAFENRNANKVYVAGVHTTSPQDFAKRQLEHHLHFSRGRSRVDDRRGKLARSSTEVISTHGDRCLLRLQPETGRTHQLRVQLAHEGAPIAGDGIYGTRVAPRMMLHAAALTLPSLGLSFESKLPASVESWLSDIHELPVDLMPSVEAAFRRRAHLADGSRATAFRCIHGAGDGLPGLYFDIYGRWGLLHVRSEACAARESEIVALLARYPFDGLYVKRRPKQANEMQSDEIASRAPKLPVVGEPAPERFEVWEDTVRFTVRMGAGMSTGIFVDQRKNRCWVREHARDKRVLNLFAYTCGFGAAALEGGASLVINVDASKNALKWGEANLVRYDTERWRNFSDDVFVYLRRAVRRGERFDIIVLDPPTYSTTKTTRFRSGKDWQGLIKITAPLLTRNGVLLCCSNDERMSMRQFRRHLQAGLEQASRDATFELRDRPPARDVRFHLSTDTPLRCVEARRSSTIRHAPRRGKSQKRRKI